MRNQEKTNGNLPLRRRDDMAPMAGSPLRGLQRNIDSLFDDFFDTDISVPISSDGWAFMPAVDIDETDNQFLICVDVPGVNKNDIHVEVRDSFLVVSGERKETRDEKKGGRRFSERSYGSFYRTLPLPSNVNSDQIKAEYCDGVLQITLPKTESTKAKTVQITEKK
jgi:HSP20 family protein